MKSIASNLYYILKLLRPRQWIKNVALFAAITFGGQLFDVEAFTNVVLGAISFSLLSSSTYIINDIIDVEKDRLHPFKKSRPIASGKVSVAQAIVVFLIIITCSFLIALNIGRLFFIIWIFYILLQIGYSFYFKNVVIFDILFIATGYILRVFAGELITGYHISIWLMLTTISISLFLAVGKRRSELTLLRHHTHAKIDQIRSTLSHYSERLLDIYIAIFSTSTFMFYSLFTYLENPRGIQITIEALMPEYLPSYLQRKWLMITILPVIYGLMRYLQDIYEKSEGESPDRVFLADRALLAAVLIYIFLVIFVIYFIQF